MFWNYARPTQTLGKTIPVIALRPTSPATPTAILQPAVDGYRDGILAAKRCYDFLLSDLHHVFADKLKTLFNTGYDEDTLAKISLSSTIRDWCDSLNPKAFEQLFPDGTEKMLSLLKNTGSVSYTHLTLPTIA